jgi:hypothetical protein
MDADLVEGYAATDLLRRKIAGLERRLLIARRLQDAAATDAAELEHLDLVARAHEILTVEPPSDPDLSQRRVAFIQAAIDEVVVDIDGEELVIEIKGALVDRHMRTPVEPLGPALAQLSTPADCLAGLTLRDSPQLFRRAANARPAGARAQTAADALLAAGTSTVAALVIEDRVLVFLAFAANPRFATPSPRSGGRNVVRSRPLAGRERGARPLCSRAVRGT